jgi:hypothetical protein
MNLPPEKRTDFPLLSPAQVTQFRTQVNNFKRFLAGMDTSGKIFKKII